MHRTFLLRDSWKASAPQPKHYSRGKTRGGAALPRGMDALKTLTELYEDRHLAEPQFRLTQAVPVVWLEDLGQPGLRSSTLPTGTMLDLAPLIFVSDTDTTRLPAKVRVNGHEGFVSVPRLKEALPGWPPAVPLEEG